MSGPFEHFEEEMRSDEVIAEHRAVLAREAAEILRQHPGAEPVGVIMEADASEAAELRRVLEQQAGRKVAGFVGVMPRRMVLDILRANHPAALDWLEDSRGPDGVFRRLPVVALTKNGVRVKNIDIDGGE